MSGALSDPRGEDSAPRGPCRSPVSPFDVLRPPNPTRPPGGSDSALPPTPTDDVLLLESTPRAGGVRAPRSATPGSSTPDIRRSAHRNQCNSARLWQREVGSPPVAEEILQTPEAFRQNRRHPSSIMRHRTSSPYGPGSPGSRSPQLWRGETIEETLSQIQSPMQSSPQTYSINAFHSLNECGTIGFSNSSSRRSSAFPIFGQSSAGVTGSVKGADGAPWNPVEERQSSPVGGSDPLKNDANDILAHKHRGEYVFTKKNLMDRIDNMERRFQHMEKAVLQALERIETHQLHLDQTLAELQEQQRQGRMYSPSISSTRVDVSMPRDETREPSRAVGS
ncbi:hypothetical protein LSM04_004243 [Trypanosoma melophagium]|uniref:uncharacterized protein n=1 Tax=Trypanosoma melophagium TaxID=715481 RepID=UPI00351A21B6|nr:hypothetical protein LSM04_004243 [Trypanosoma melophagium]